MVLHVRIRTGSDSWFSKNLHIRIGSDSTFSDQDWTQTENFTVRSSQVDLPARENNGAPHIHYAAVDWFSISLKLADIKVIVVNRPYFEARTRPEPEITSPNLAWARHLFLKSDLVPKAKSTKWLKTCASAGYQKTSCTGIAAGTRFYHTLNSKHLNQNIGLNNHKLSLLVNDNIADCKASQERETWRQAISISEWDIDLSHSSRCVKIKSKCSLEKR